MDILVIMCLGILIGNRFFPEKYKTINEKLQLACTLILIFSMGRMLGSRENFFEELLSLGFTSFLFFAIPSIFSVILVFIFSERYMVRKKDRKLFKKQSESLDTIEAGEAGTVTTEEA
ncbi:MAG: hypothetical protein Q4B86_03020 [Eubacteriales bacterium]|nr:hypothetical protein [Eubacteriales bacterium]